MNTLLVFLRAVTAMLSLSLAFAAVMFLFYDRLNDIPSFAIAAVILGGLAIVFHKWYRRRADRLSALIGIVIDSDEQDPYEQADLLAELNVDFDIVVLEKEDISALLIPGYRGITPYYFAALTKQGGQELPELFQRISYGGESYEQFKQYIRSDSLYSKMLMQQSAPDLVITKKEEA
jgi:hypothetical protein